VFARCGRDVERTACARHAAAVRERMPGVTPLSATRKRALIRQRPFRANPEHRAERHRRGRGTRVEHRRRGLAGGDHVNGPCVLQLGVHRGIVQGTAY